MEKELKALELRVTELENQLKNQGIAGASAEVDPEEMKVFQKVMGQMSKAQAISPCLTCRTCTTCTVCRVCTVCVTCRVCKVCTVCINECSCGPCIMGGKTSGMEASDFDDFGM